jgi:uncharacterized membrane protein
MTQQNTDSMITLYAHVYRGELGRAQMYNEDVDETSNWSISVTAILLSLSVSQQNVNLWLNFLITMLLLLFMHKEVLRYQKVIESEGRIYNMIQTIDCIATSNNLDEIRNRIHDDLCMNTTWPSYWHCLYIRFFRVYIWFLIVVLVITCNQLNSNGRLNLAISLWMSCTMLAFSSSVILMKCVYPASAARTPENQKFSFGLL